MNQTELVTYEEIYKLANLDGKNTKSKIAALAFKRITSIKQNTHVIQVQSPQSGTRYLHHTYSCGDGTLLFTQDISEAKTFITKGSALHTLRESSILDIFDLWEVIRYYG